MNYNSTILKNEAANLLSERDLLVLEDFPKEILDISVDGEEILIEFERFELLISKEEDSTYSYWLYGIEFQNINSSDMTPYILPDSIQLHETPFDDIVDALKLLLEKDLTIWYETTKSIYNN